MNIPFKVTVTDKRHKANPHFKWMIEHPIAHAITQSNSDAIIKFADIRQWCTNTWGTGVEIDMWKFLNTRQIGEIYFHNNHWCYDVNTTNTPQMKLYLKTDAELAFYKLKWS